jgi:hypothetical protein
MKTFEYILTFTAVGFMGFRAANFLLMRTFFKQTSERLRLMHAHTDLRKSLKIDNRV